MDSSDIWEQLFQSNPFFSGTANDPWENKAPDVVSLNQNAYEHICGLIRAKHQSPGESLTGLILGESGMGKTHLLKRLLDYTISNSMSTIFASVRPFLDPSRPMRHLLSEIVVSLTKVKSPEGLSSDASSKISQFECLTRKIVQKYSENNASAKWHGLKHFVTKIMRSYSKNKLESKGITFQEWDNHFQRSCPGVHGNLLKAVFDYHDSSKQGLTLNWLEGRVHEDHAAIMNFLDRASMKDEALEAEAHDIIVSLGMLLKYCGMSMVVCFDQLDGIRDQLIDAFGHAVQVLINEVNGMLPLAFIRMDTWAKRFNKLDPAVAGRLTGNVIRLWGCTVDQAQELIKVRVEHRFKDNEAEKIFKWLMERLNGKLKENDSPREIIHLANRAITHAAELPQEAEKPEQTIDVNGNVIEVFNAEYLKARDEVAQDFGKWQPNAEHILSALKTYLENRPEYNTLQLNPDKTTSIGGRWLGPDGEEIACAFIINTAEHHMAVQVCFKHGIKFLQQYPNGLCYYISDGRCVFRDKTRWKKVHKLKEVFDKLRGRTLFLDKYQAVLWYGLASLIFKLKAGDISLPDAEGLRIATEEDFALYMKDGFKEDFLESSL